MKINKIEIVITILTVSQLISCNAKPKRWKEIQLLVQKGFGQVLKDGKYVEKTVVNLTDDIKYLKKTVSNLTNELDYLKNIMESQIPLDCSSALKKGIWSTVTLVAPPGHSPRYVRCDQETEGGGWTVVVNRIAHRNVNEDFKRPWQEYKDGFGLPKHEYWLGNDIMHALTMEGPWEVMVIAKRWNGDIASARWDFFRVLSEDEKYQLEISGYRNDISTLQDGLAFHNSSSFSTYDSDNDGHEEHCAKLYGGGWWFHQCHVSYLTGIHLRPGESGDNSVHWSPWQKYESLMSAKLMIRPRNFL